MIKTRSMYICQNCEYQTSQWVGQCPGCSEWNTLVETVVAAPSKSSGGGLGGTNGRSMGRLGPVPTPVYLSKVMANPPKRILTGIKEFDRVLGGGFVPGQVTLISGDPGIGKSTLLTQISKSMGEATVMYVCGEESMEQIKVRADRMDYKADNLLMLNETDVDNIVAAIDKKMSLVIVDSIQTVSSTELLGMAGSVGQVRGGTQKLTNVAKQLGVPIIIVGHVTKEGTVAGPKVLEHIVDTVLYLEGDAQHMFRILKTIKNRFGPVSEVGIFEMSDVGMTQVENPSKLFLDQKLKNSSGSCVTIVMEGFRPLLFEVQALTTRTSFGYPRRTTSGVNVNRVQVLIAILEKSCGINLSNHDVYVSVAGGFKISEYAADLAICAAIASALKDSPIKDTIAVFGECGLAGELRRVPHQEKRISEAKKLGYDKVISPESAKSLRQAIDQLIAKS